MIPKKWQIFPLLLKTLAIFIKALVKGSVLHGDGPTSCRVLGGGLDFTRMAFLLTAIYQFNVTNTSRLCHGYFFFKS